MYRIPTTVTVVNEILVIETPAISSVCELFHSISVCSLAGMRQRFLLTCVMQRWTLVLVRITWEGSDLRLMDGQGIPHRLCSLYLSIEIRTVLPFN